MIDVAAITEWTRANRRARAAYYSGPICNPCKYQNRKKRTA